jgi:hypothetical protein
MTEKLAATYANSVSNNCIGSKHLRFAVSKSA